MDRWPHKQSPKAWSPPETTALLAAVPIPSDKNQLNRDEYRVLMADRLAWMLRQAVGNDPAKAAAFLERELPDADLGNLHQAESLWTLAFWVVTSPLVESRLEAARSHLPSKVETDPHAVAVIQETDLQTWLAELRQ